MSTKLKSNTFSNAIVFGAAGAMGQMIQRMLASGGHHVVGADLVTAPEVESADLSQLTPSWKEALGHADLVVLAVPDDVAVENGGAIANILKPNALLVDCTSIKAPYVAAISNIGECGLLSINPLFGPGLSWTNRTIAVTDIRRVLITDTWINFLRTSGVSVLPLSPEKHDLLASEAQASIHAFLIAYCSILSKETISFDTPPSVLVLSMGARLLKGEPHVYWGIQKLNPFAKKARKNIIAALAEIDRIVKADEYDEFLRLLDEMNTNLGDCRSYYANRCLKLFNSISSDE